MPYAGWRRMGPRLRETKWRDRRMGDRRPGWVVAHQVGTEAAHATRRRPPSSRFAAAMRAVTAGSTKYETLLSPAARRFGSRSVGVETRRIGIVGLQPWKTTSYGSPRVVAFIRDGRGEVLHLDVDPDLLHVEHEHLCRADARRCCTCRGRAWPACTGTWRAIERGCRVGAASSRRSSASRPSTRKHSVGRAWRRDNRTPARAPAGRARS